MKLFECFEDWSVPDSGVSSGTFLGVSSRAFLMRLARAISNASRFDTASFFAMVPPSPPSHWRGGAGQAHRRWKMCDGWPAGPAPCRFYSTPIWTDPDPYPSLLLLGAPSPSGYTTTLAAASAKGRHYRHASIHAVAGLHRFLNRPCSAVSRLFPCVRYRHIAQLDPQPDWLAPAL
jgi:hypothetical protein